MSVADLPEPPSTRLSRGYSQKVDTTSLTGRNGVSVFWLSQVFGMTPENVRRRLGKCPVLTKSGKGFTYDIAVAARYLVDPVVDLDEYLKTLKSTDLPGHLQKEIWDARLKRQRWEKEAGELWHTDDVLTVLSLAFSIIKANIQLWPDTLERETELTDTQRDVMIRLGDTLQDEIYNTLLAEAAKRTTRASIKDVELDELRDFQEEDNDWEDIL